MIFSKKKKRGTCWVFLVRDNLLYLESNEFEHTDLLVQGISKYFRCRVCELQNYYCKIFAFIRYSIEIFVVKT